MIIHVSSPLVVTVLATMLWRHGCAAAGRAVPVRRSVRRCRRVARQRTDHYVTACRTVCRRTAHDGCCVHRLRGARG